jgi:hypothetical protein
MTVERGRKNEDLVHGLLEDAREEFLSIPIKLLVDWEVSESTSWKDMSQPHLPQQSQCRRIAHHWLQTKDVESTKMMILLALTPTNNDDPNTDAAHGKKSADVTLVSENCGVYNRNMILK